MRKSPPKKKPSVTLALQRLAEVKKGIDSCEGVLSALWHEVHDIEDILLDVEREAR